jgi:hypothetical protein
VQQLAEQGAVAMSQALVPLRLSIEIMGNVVLEDVERPTKWVTKMGPVC